MKHSFTTLIFLLSVNSLFAQHELSLNVSNILFYEVNVNYEYVENTHIGLGLSASYVFNTQVESNTESQPQFFYISPDVRYYINPSKGADGMFLGVITKFSSGNYNLVSYNPNLGQVKTSTDFNRLSLGFEFGGKWLINNFILGFRVGAGRNVYIDFEKEALVNEIYNNNPTFKYFDFTFGFSVGWRFLKN